ncbi:MAG: TIGR00730 family Rossman fold protein [Vicinamibacterales bacterium]
MKRVCVFAGSSPGVRQDYRHAAAALGHTIAARGMDIVYGGAHVGLMGAVADAVLAGGREVVGVIPEALVARELAHGGLTELRIVQTMHERKAVMADLADAFIALPGGWGTLEEFFEVLTWAQLRIHAKPCGLLNVAGYFDPLLTFLDHTITEGFVREAQRPMVTSAETPEALLDALARYTAPPDEKWTIPKA